MGTGCFIGVEQEDGTVKYIIRTHDGYPEGTVPLLLLGKGDKSEMLENILQYVDDDNEIYVTDKVYQEATCEYNYLFTKDNEWLYMEREHADFVTLNVNKYKNYIL